jgi:hypothetical protein
VVCELRRLFGDGLLERKYAGYVLRIDPEQVDSHRFEQLLRRALSEPPAERVHTLEAALALWHGKPLLDVYYEDCAQFEIRRLDNLRVAALERLEEASLATGTPTWRVARFQAPVDLVEALA